MPECAKAHLQLEFQIFSKGGPRTPALGKAEGKEKTGKLDWGGEMKRGEKCLEGGEERNKGVKGR